MPISIGAKILLAASGLRPIASIALRPIMPIAIAGKIPPIAITDPFAKIISNLFHLLFHFFSVCVFLLKAT